MIIQLIAIILFSILSGIFGRMGGSSNYNSNWRDFGINILHILYFILCSIWSPWLILYVGLFKASISSYWDWLFGYDNFWMHGFMLGFCGLVISIITGHYWLMLFRSIGLGLFTGIWHKFHPNKIRLFKIDWDGAQIEEFGRYFVLTATLPIII